MKKPKIFNPRPEGFRPRVFKSQTRDWAYLYQNYRWRKYRDAFIKANPTCYACGDKSEVCDHIVPHKGNLELFENTENHLPLCSLDHNYCTANFDKFDKPKTAEKIKYLTDKRKANNLVKKVFILSRLIYFPKV